MNNWRSYLLDRVPVARAVVNRARLHRRFGALRVEMRQRLFSRTKTIQVQAGPFAGMRYFDAHVWGIISNKWLGSYEAELHSIVEQICQTPYRRVIDIGCAEGWYAIGLLFRMRDIQMLAYDTDPISRRQCQRLARLNGVSHRLQMGGLCTAEILESLAGAHTLVVCDIEGAEAFLLDPARTPKLASTDILVELHESQSGSHELEELLRARFHSTHQITSVRAEDRREWLATHAGQWSPSIPANLLREAAEEHRAPGNGWLWMTANGQG